MRRFLFILAICLLCSSCCHRKNITVIVSLDGFRYDYAERFDTPNLDLIGSDGVKAVMMPSYPASTFPNHYTLATGLVPDHNGIIQNSFLNRETGEVYSMGDSIPRNKPSYYNGEPIWNTAERQGVTTACIYWVGSDIKINGSYPTYYRYWYDTPRLTYPERVDETLRLLSLPKKQRPRLIMTYFDEPDGAGHNYGPYGEGTRDQIAYLDSLMGVLYQGIKALPISSRVNLIVTSDHGMAEISDERFVPWDLVKEEWYDRMEATTPTHIYCKPEYCDSIVGALKDVPHISVWKKGEVPQELSYGTNPNSGDVIVAPDLGWQFASKGRGLGGAHGYSPYDPEMQVVFRASGPDFKKGFVMKDKFRNVDIYPLLSHLLGIKPSPTDGDLDRISPILR